MAIRKSQVYLSLANSYLIDSPQPSTINYWYNLGSLLGLCLIIQIASGIFLAMHYSSHIDLAFASVEHIMRDVNYGYLIRYIHANGASFFFICMYAHIGKALYYGSYKSPRVLVWIIGVVIFVITMATAFLGYCCVYGQMSHWGIMSALNIIILILFINKIILESNFILFKKDDAFDAKYINKKEIDYECNSRYKINNKKGPLNIDILSIIYGSLLGDAYAEKRKKGSGTRICFYQESTHIEYLLYLHYLVSKTGYCNTNKPIIQQRLGSKGKIRKIIRFTTWTYNQFNIIHNNWYKNNIKIVPKNIKYYLTPLALAIWIMDDGGKVGEGLKLATNSFKYEDILYLINILNNKYNLKASIQKTGIENQYHIYIFKESMPILRDIVKPYFTPSMYYKIL